MDEVEAINNAVEEFPEGEMEMKAKVGSHVMNIMKNKYGLNEKEIK